MRAVRLLILSNAGEPSPWLIASGSGEVLERGIARPGDAEPKTVASTVVVVPGHDVLIRRMAVPGRTDPQARAAAAWLLRDSLAQAPERTRIVLGPPLGDGQRLVAVAAVGLAEAWIAEVESLGMRADVILPDSLLPEAPAEDGDPGAIRWGDRRLVRARDHAFSAEHALCDAILGERRLRYVTEPERIEALMIRAALRPDLNLLAANDRPDRSGGGRLRPALLAGLLALSPAIHLAAAGARDAMAARRLESSSSAAVRAAYPDIGPFASPGEEVRRRAADVAFPGGALAAAAVLAHALEKVPGARLETLAVEDGRVSATVGYGSPADLDGLGSSLRARGVDLEVESTSSDGGRITSDLRLRSRS